MTRPNPNLHTSGESFTAQLATWLAEENDPHTQIAVARRNWGHINPDHPQTRQVIDCLTEARRVVPLPETLFDFERNIYPAQGHRDLVHGTILLEAGVGDLEGAVSEAINRPYPFDHRDFCVTKDMARNRHGSPGEGFQEVAFSLICPEDQILFYYYRREGFYEPVWRGAGILTASSIEVRIGDGDWIPAYF